MLLRNDTLEGIRAGTIDLAFRRWKRATVKTGGRLRTRIGELAIDAVEPIAMAKITDAEARRAGYESRAPLLAELKGREGTTYRVRLRLAGPDPRIALREQKRLSKAEVAEIATRLDRMDARSKDGPWTRVYLACIRDNPATRAPDLAASFGLETKPFKQRVRRLKELGLTKSLKVGYELSPRGRAFLKAD